MTSLLTSEMVLKSSSIPEGITFTNKRETIDKVYFLLAGSVQKVDEKSLDIDEALDISVK